MRGNDWEWVGPAAVFVAVQFVIGAVLARALGYAPTPPILDYLYAGTLFGLVAGLAFLLYSIFKVMRAGVDQPTKVLARSAIEHKRVLLAALVGAYLVALQMASLTWLKGMLPIAIPFWADPMLAELDRMIFLGTDPWRLIHPLPEAAHLYVDTVYILWFPVKAFVLAAVLAFAPCKFKSRAMLAYFLTVGIFGVAGQYALSSAGPLFYDRIGLGSDFSSLPVSPVVAEARDYLWAVYEARHGNFGSGISAMPSVHVALATWIALTVQSLWHRLAPLGWLFYATILFGSVYTGWHYFSDGVVGTLAALLAWKLSALVLEREWKWLALRPQLRAEAAN